MKRVVLYMVLCPLLFSVMNGCSKSDEGPSNIIELPDDLPVNESYRTTILLSDSAWTKAIIQAGHAQKFDEGQRRETLINEGLHIRFLNRDGGINVILKADSARLDDVTGDMCAFGKVNVYSKQNRTAVDTDKLCYDKENERFHSDATVKLVDTLKGRSIRGKGFESDESLKKYTIYEVSADVTQQ